MRNVRKVMKGKLAFKEEIDRRLSAEDSEKVWKQAHKRLAKMYRDYSNLPKGVSNHTDSFIFPAAAIYLSIRKVAPEEAFDIMKVVMKARTEKMGQTIAKMTGIPGFKSFFLKMWGGNESQDVWSHGRVSECVLPEDKRGIPHGHHCVSVSQVSDGAGMSRDQYSVL